MSVAQRSLHTRKAHTTGFGQRKSQRGSGMEGSAMKLRAHAMRYLMAISATLVFTMSATAQPTQQVQYFGYYAVQDEEQGNYNYISEVNGYSNIAWISPDHSVLTPTLGAQYDSAGLKLIVDLGISQERLKNPTGSDMTNYLDQIYAELDSANLLDNVVAVAPAEEWHNRVIYGVE